MSDQESTDEAQGMSEWPAARRGMLHIAAATTAFALWHSLLCSRVAKEGAQRWLGERRGKALYRLFFNAQSFPTSGALVLFILRQPARTLYDQRGTARVACWFGQAACLLIGWHALHDIGPNHFAGLESLQKLRDDKPFIEPEAQGPPLEPDKRVRVTGVYRWSRHPLEWAPIL
ncbi:MAG: NnrU protein, partial [Abditibacteriota bacterium]|nr:NnrU protein [Abditibacteriota bacterium]